MAGPLCPVCRHPTRKHDDTGCSAADGSCACDQTRAMLATEFDEPATPVESEPVTVPPPPEALARVTAAPGRPRRRPVTPEERQTLNLEALRAELRAILRRFQQQRREPTTEEQARIAELRKQLSVTRSTGVTTAKVVAVSDSTAGTGVEEPRRLGGPIQLGTSWLCRAHVDRTHTSPGRCPACDGPLDRHHIYAERAADG